MDLKTLRESDETVTIFPGAKVVGDVTFGPECSVWYNAVLRGDSGKIILGRGCNVQDNAVFHGDGKVPTVLGDGVTVGHGAIVHSCSVGDHTLIGMGAIILSGAKIGKNCIVAAGALVTGKTVVPDGYLVMGNPAKIIRQLTNTELEYGTGGSEYYIYLKGQYC